MADIKEPEQGLWTVGAFLAACLHGNGVDTVYGIPGTHNLEIYRGIKHFGIRHVLTRNEQGAVYAADGYARASGTPGVVIATSGPGVTNCITGIANAYADRVPLLVVSPGVPSGKERLNLGFLHEAKDQRAGIDNFALKSIRAESKIDVENALNEIFLRFKLGDKRPVHLEVPTDVLVDECDSKFAGSWSGATLSADPNIVGELFTKMTHAKKPIIIAGGGCLDSAPLLTNFAKQFNIPVVTTVQGKGVISEHEALSLGALAGGSSPLPMIAEADLVFALATELKYPNISQDAFLIRVDDDIEQLHKNHTASLAILDKVDVFLSAMLKHAAEGEVFMPEDWAEEIKSAADEFIASAVSSWGELYGRVIDVAERDNREAIITGDSSQVSWVGAVKAAKLTRPRAFLTTDGYATLGYGLPAAIGAKLAKPEANVAAIIGDGALMFTVQELLTASELGIPLAVIVVDNGGYAEIKQNMLDASIKPFAVDLEQPEYKFLAAGLRCNFASIGSLGELDEILQDAFTATAPTLIHINAQLFA